ncbi:hypothetical protein D3C76_1591670 [compost metagenome]
MYAKIQGALAGPFASTLLSGCILNDIHHRLACFGIDLREDIGRNLNQVAVQLSLIPFGEDFMKLRCA